ncbi:MAG: hypothetical protein ACOVP4_13930 [Bacteriovoracaceae bacterium]
MKLFLMGSLALLSIATNAQSVKPRMTVKCNDGTSFKANKIIIGQDTVNTGRETIYLHFNLENGISEPLYRMVKKSDVVCKVVAE